MPDFTPEDLDITPSEFVGSCNSKEIDELIEVLVEDGHIEPDRAAKNGSYGVRNPNVNDTRFWENLEHLKKCRDLLSIHEENYINNIAERYKHLRC